VVFGLVPPCALRAQTPLEAFDPSDVWFQAWMSSRDADKLAAAGKFSEALDKYEHSRQMFENVAKIYPEWKKDMVGGRLAATRETIDALKPKAEAEQLAKQRKVADFEGGVRPAPEAETRTPGQIRAAEIRAGNMGNTAERQRIAELERQIAALKDATRKGEQKLADQLRQANNDLQAARAKPQATPAERQRIPELERQIREMEEKTRKENLQLVQQLNKTSADLEAARAVDNSVERHRIAELERQIAALKDASSKGDQKLADQLKQANSELQAARAKPQATPAERERIPELERQIREMEEKSRRENLQLAQQLNQTNADLEAARIQMAKAPAQSELDRVNKKVAELEGQREAMALALRQSRSDHSQAQARIAALEADIANSRQSAAEIQNNLTKEREVSNQVSRGMQKQLADLNASLTKKSEELAAAQKTIATLSSDLDETRAAFHELQDERNTLLRDKEQMSALLNLNDAGRIKELIEQNMALAKELREAKERFDIVKDDNATNKEAYLEAVRDLRIAKANILNLRKDNRDQQLRLEDLEKSLREARNDLANNAGNPEETEILKNVIRTQLLQQVRRREARQVLLTHAKRIGQDQPALKEAMQVLEDDELKLTPEEQKAIAMEQADGEFVSPVARPQRHEATTELHQTITNYRKAAEKAFTAGRYKASEEVLRLILEEHPMHSSTLNSLGVVMLRQDQNDEAVSVFNDAITMNETNPFAHRMLGFALYRLGRLPEAEAELRKAVDLNPADAKAHVLLGNLASSMGRNSEAENHFKAAIAADSALSEPYFNLAFLAESSGRKGEGQKLYKTALENGALPDPALEARLAK
jgi:chromosome segregation ATPase